MNKLHSCGIIPVRKRTTGQWEFLIIEHVGGSWSFPKGTQEKGETLLETALRETEEEVGITKDQLSFINDLTFSETYDTTHITRGTPLEKEVSYLLTMVHGDPTITLQASEARQYRWALYEEAHQLFHYPSRQAVLDQAHYALTTMDSEV